MSTARERFMNATKLVKAGRTGQSLVEPPATSRERFINATRLVKLGSPQTALSGGQGNSEANSAPRSPLPPYLTGGTYTPPTPYAAGLQAKQEREQSAAPVMPQKAQTFTPKPTVQKTESEHQAFDMAMGYQKAMAAQKQAAKTQRLAQLDIGAAEKRAAELKAAAKDAKTAQAAVDADPKYTYWDGVYESAGAANEAYLADSNAAWETRKKIDDELAALNQDIESAKLVQYSLLPTRDDFQVYAARGGGMKNNAVMPVKRSGDGAVIGLEVMEKLFPKTQESSPTKSIYDKLTDEEARIYNYLLAKDAERGTSHAFEYLSFMMDPMKARRGREQADLVKNSGPLRPVATVGYGLASGFDRAVTGIAQNFSDTPIPASELQYGAGYVREDLDGAGPKILGSSLGQIGFDLAVTTGNMAPSIGAGVVGGPAAAAGVTFLSAGGNAYGEALAQGYSKGEARAYGILAGASEAGLQYALSGISSLGGKLPNSEAVQSALNNIQRAALRIPAKYAVAAAGEMTEEYLQEILTPVFRNLALGENNEFKLFTEDAAYAALLSALSVGVLEGPNIVTTDISMNKAGRTAENGTGTGVDSRLYADMGMDSPAFQNPAGGTKTPGEYRLNKPRNVEMPTVPIINLSLQNIPGVGDTLPTAGNALRSDAIKRARTRLGLDQNSAAYIPASNVTRDGNEYVLKITKATLNKMLSTPKGAILPVESILIMDNLERIANNGVWFGNKGDKYGRPQVAGYDYLKTTVYIEGAPYEVKMRVRLVEEKPGKGADNVLYYFSPEEILTIERVGTTPPTYGRRASILHSEDGPTLGVGTASPTGERRALTMGSEGMPTLGISIPQTSPQVNQQTATPAGKISDLEVLRKLAEEMASSRTEDLGPDGLVPEISSRPVQQSAQEILSLLAREMTQDPTTPLASLSDEDIKAMLDKIARGQGGETALAEADTPTEGGESPFTDEPKRGTIGIGRSLGAKAVNYDVMDLVTGEVYHFAEGTKIQNVEVFAGKGRRTTYRRAAQYADLYGGKPEDWQHAKGFGVLSTPDGDRRAEVHWSQCDGIGKFDFFVKEWLD